MMNRIKPPTTSAASRIDSKMQKNGFPEMELLWRYYKKNYPGADPEQISNTQLNRLRRMHMGILIDHPLIMVVVSAIVGFAMWHNFHFIMFGFAYGTSRTVYSCMRLLYVLNTLFLFWYIVLVIQRYWIHPMMKIMSLDLAFMLCKENYGVWFNRTENARKVRQELDRLGIKPLWDNPAYRKKYRPAHGEYQEASPENETKHIQSVLRDCLGYLDPEKRKFQPGKYLSCMRNGKKSVTRFIISKNNQTS